jgi:hypothetical protein
MCEIAEKRCSVAATSVKMMWLGHFASAADLRLAAHQSPAERQGFYALQQRHSEQASDFVTNISRSRTDEAVRKLILWAGSDFRKKEVLVVSLYGKKQSKQIMDVSTEFATRQEQAAKGFEKRYWRMYRTSILPTLSAREGD